MNFTSNTVIRLETARLHQFTATHWQRSRPISPFLLRYPSTLSHLTQLDKLERSILP